MLVDRRRFLKSVWMAGGACLSARAAALWPAVRQQVSAEQNALPSQRRLAVLVLGGTGFLGPHIVRHARQRGHSITLFNRGKTNPELFADLEQLRGDRNGELEALRGRAFDAVIDTSGTLPDQVRKSAELLGQLSQHYLFLSSVSVYRDFLEPGMDENAPLLSLLPDQQPEDLDQGLHHGLLKVLCEEAAYAAMPERVTVVRPGLLVGPGDPRGQFTYWPCRVEEGGRVLAPGQPTDPVQFVDARDLAAWLVDLIERGVFGTFHATGPAEPLEFGRFLERCRKVTNSAAEFVWVPAEFLLEQGLTPWWSLPMWVPGEGDSAGFCRLDVGKAVAHGLKFRALEHTLLDTLAWYREQQDLSLRFGLTREQENKVLERWSQR